MFLVVNNGEHMLYPQKRCVMVSVLCDAVHVKAHQCTIDHYWFATQCRPFAPSVIDLLLAGPKYWHCCELPLATHDWTSIFSALDELGTTCCMGAQALELEHGPAVLHG